MNSGAKRLVAPVDNRMLVADLRRSGPCARRKQWRLSCRFIAGGQCPSGLPPARRDPGGAVPHRRSAFGSTEETDGIELDPGEKFSALDFPRGIFIAQDGINPPQAQNFKLLRRWV